MSDQDPPDVDFVVDAAGSGPDEELPQPGEREWPWLRRAKRPLAVAAGFAVAVVAVLKLISFSDDGKPSPAAAPSSATRTGSFEIRIPAPDVFPSGGGNIYSLSGSLIVRLPSGSLITVRASDGQIVQRVPTLPANPTLCLPGVSCISSLDLPPAVLAAVREAFPGARVQSATTVLTHGDAPGSRLWFRQVSARAGTYDILIRVRQSRDSDQLIPETVNLGRRSITSVVLRSHGLTVQVQVDAPAGKGPARRTVQQLAADRRLVMP